MIQSVELGVPFEHHRFVTEDGWELAVQTTGKGPVLLYANGIGVRYSGVAPLLDEWRRHYRVVCWDYRGMGESTPEREPRDVSVQKHARDGFAVLDYLGVDKAPVIGWSMGVPVGFEMIRQQPERVAAFVPLFGTAGVPFETGFPKPVGRALRGFFHGLAAVPQAGQLGLDLAMAFPDLVFGLLAATSFVGRTAPRRAFDNQIAGVSRVNKRTYFRTMLELARHDARDLLPRITCPVLVIGGENDWLTPPAAAREMAEAIPGSELELLDKATHFGVIEQCREVGQRVLDWGL
jgi:pimeloyl-ACP methyl ester carboxylesterase